MRNSIDYIFVPQAEINEVSEHPQITRGAIYFTKDHVFVLPFQTFPILLAGTDSEENYTRDNLADLKKQVKALDLDSFNNLMNSILLSENIFKVAELEIFSVIVGFWIFGSIKIQKKGSNLYTFNIQPAALRARIKRFYGLS